MPFSEQVLRTRPEVPRIGCTVRRPSLDHKLEIGLGMRVGEEKVDKAAATLGKDVNGWKVGSPFGDRTFFHGDWLLRAASAKAGIYGNEAVEATYPQTKTLADGQPLDGRTHRYTLTFSAGQYPPVHAFWSVTMYDGRSSSERIAAPRQVTPPGCHRLRPALADLCPRRPISASRRPRLTRGDPFRTVGPSGRRAAC